MSEQNEHIPTAIRFLLKPILRLCIRHSIKLQELLEMVKVMLVQVAKEELVHQRQPVSASKISVMTGVHRKDVTRLEISGGEYQRPANPIAKIVTQWQCHPSFTTKAGKPRVLECEGKESEFAELVASVNGLDVSSYSILYELERAEFIERRGKRVKLLARDIVHREDIQAGLQVLVHDSNDLISAVEENLFTESDHKNLHLRTEFDRIPLKKLDEAKQWLLEEGSAFHKRVRSYLSTLDLDTSPSPSDTLDEATGRISLGTFSISEDLTSQGEPIQ